jgi:hypothetical protein
MKIALHEIAFRVQEDRMNSRITNRAVPTVGQSSALESGGPQFRLV